MKIAPIVLALALAGMGLAPVAAADNHDDVVITVPVPVQDQQCAGTPGEPVTVGGQERSTPVVFAEIDGEEVVRIGSVSISVPQETVDPPSVLVCIGEE